MAHPEGIDPEVKGRLDFYWHYLEILQAFSLMPGCTELARMPSPAYWMAVDLVNKRTAPFEAAYAADPRLQVVTRGPLVPTFRCGSPPLSSAGVYYT